MNEQKTIKDYTVEELKSMLVGTKANILDFQERLQLENQNRQVIEQELKGRVEEKKETEEALTNVIEEVAKPKDEWSEDTKKAGKEAKKTK